MRPTTRTLAPFSRTFPELLLALTLAAPAACGGPSAPADTGADGGADAGPACSPPYLCYPACDGNGCLQGTLDEAACVCRGADGTALPWPDGTQKPTALAFSPALPAHVGLGSHLILKIVAIQTGVPDRDVTADADLQITPANLFDKVGPGHYRALAEGTAQLQATWSGAEGLQASGQLEVRKEEARAVWVTRFAYHGDAVQGTADIQRLVDAAADAHFNIVLLQVRAEADAYYASTVEPWSARLSGTLGKDPGWDPLGVGLARAHARGIELHAYVNAFSGWSSAAGAVPASAAGAPEHVLHAHPEWVEEDSHGGQDGDGYWWLAPGADEVRAHNVAVVKDLLARYAVDGIHLDRIRYAGPDFGHSAASVAAYAAKYGNDASHWTEFRVGAVDDQVRAIYAGLRDVRPAAKLSAAVWGIYQRLPGCSTSQGLADYYQDSLAWTEGGYIDALAPMIYWAEQPDSAHSCTDYGQLLAQFLARRGSRQVWAGMHVLDTGTGCSGNCAFDFAKLGLRITTARAAGADGVTLFATQYLDDNHAWSLLGSGPFQTPVPPPTTSWR
jgi:uncharacterized lipoprotein YddW (UPF0748 family)